MILSLIPHLSLKLWSLYGMEQFLTAELPDIFTASGRMWFYFCCRHVSWDWKEREKMENTWDPSKNSCEALIVPKLDATKHWKFSMTNGYKCRERHVLGHLGQSHWIFRCPRYASIIFLNQNSSKLSCHHEINVLHFVQFGNPPKKIFPNLRKRFIRIWIVQRYSWNSF